jgi:hypothetical protein
MTRSNFFNFFQILLELFISANFNRSTLRCQWQRRVKLPTVDNDGKSKLCVYFNTETCFSTNHLQWRVAVQIIFRKCPVNVYSGERLLPVSLRRRVSDSSFCLLRESPFKAESPFLYWWTTLPAFKEQLGKISTIVTTATRKIL